MFFRQLAVIQFHRSITEILNTLVHYMHALQGVRQNDTEKNCTKFFNLFDTPVDLYKLFW